jgi:hypothetical protein
MTMAMGTCAQMNLHMSKCIHTNFGAFSGQRVHNSAKSVANCLKYGCFSRNELNVFLMVVAVRGRSATR